MERKNSMLRAVHIHTDPKFLSSTQVFENPKFENRMLVILRKGAHRINALRKDSENIRYFSTSRADRAKILDHCSNAHLVVLYDLDNIKARIACMLPERAVVAWRFFGSEIYSLNARKYLSPRSIQLHNAPVRRLRRFFRSMLETLLHGRFPNELFKDAAARVDLFLGLSHYEYSYLKKTYSYLPQFVQWPIAERKHYPEHFYHKSDTVIIGNSRTEWNNHLEIIDIVERIECFKYISFLLPFSYGRGTNYIDKVRTRVIRSKANISLLEHFMPREDYFAIVTGAKAAVFNNYRQMAMGNIFTLLNNGVKLYFNKKNQIFTWLRECGFFVYSIEDLETDLKDSAKLELPKSEKEQNRTVLKLLCSKFTRGQMLETIINACNAKQCPNPAAETISNNFERKEYYR